MRICLITDRYLPEARASAYHTSTLAEGWSRLGHDVTVLTRRPTQYVPETSTGDQPSGIRVVRMAGLTASLSIAARVCDQLAVIVRMAVFLLRMRRPDAFYVLSPPLLLVLPVLLASWLRRIPYVLNLHDLYPQAAIDLGVLRSPILIGLARRIESLAYRRAARILVAAPASREILRADHGIGDSRIEVLWNFVDCRDAAAANGAAFRRKHELVDRFIVLYAGQLGLAQDLDLVLDCAGQALEHEDWHFVVIGDGPRANEWRRRAASLSNVTMLGLLATAEYFQAVRACDVALAPLSARFLAPAIPGKIQTIMACGRPVVAAVPPRNESRGLLAESGAGIAVDAGDTRALYLALSSLARSAPLREQMGRNGEQFARAHFDSATAIQQTVCCLETASGLPSQPSADREFTTCTRSSS
jgi:colanic acid biosynthesis glycosyl transferase WcaI